MLGDVFEVICPHCGEQIELAIEADVSGQVIENCQVCCRSLQILVTRDEWGDPDIRVERAE